MSKKLGNALDGNIINNPIATRVIFGVLVAILMTVLYAFAVDVYKLPHKNSDEISTLKQADKVHDEQINKLNCDFEKSYRQIEKNQQEIIELIKGKK